LSEVVIIHQFNLSDSYQHSNYASSSTQSPYVTSTHRFYWDILFIFYFGSCYELPA